MIKSARKTSTDPIQEKLRQNKDSWNKEVSGLINDLIHFKRLVNGWPNKFFDERSKIIEPIPANPSKILSDLMNTYNKINQIGKNIIEEQVQYSKNRKKNKN